MENIDGSEIYKYILEPQQIINITKIELGLGYDKIKSNLASKASKPKDYVLVVGWGGFGG